MSIKWAFLLLIAGVQFLISDCRAAIEIRDTEIENAVYEITRPLADAAKIPFNRMKIHIVNDNSFNAFVSGGTDIFINTGLLTKIDSFAELQAVLAHEIGHAQLGHIVQMAAKARAETARYVAMQMLGVAAAALYNAQAGIGIAAAGTGMAAQSMLAFTRDEERSADDYAVNLMSKAGLDPSALISVFQKMQNMQSQNKVNPSNINHPLTEERIKNIKLHVRSNDGKPAHKDADDKLKLIQAKLAGYLDSPERTKTLYPPADKSDAALYARAIARIRGGDLTSAKTGTLTLASRHEKNPYFYELLGDIEFQSGHYDDSVRAYEQSLKLIKSAPQIELALALVLAERNKPADSDRAAKLCRRAILTEPMPLAYWVMAKVDQKKSDYYLAEYYYMARDLKRAKDHAARAAKQLPPDSPEYLKARDILDVK